MGVFSSIAGGLLGLGGSIWSSKQNQKSADQSIAFQREVLQNRNQWAVDDLKAAGLNPILAAGATNSTASGAQATADNPSTGAVSSAMATKQMNIMERQQRNQDMVMKSQADLNSAKAQREFAEVKDLTEKSDSGYYVRTSDYLGSSAKQAEGSISWMKSQESEINERVRESQARQTQIAEHTKRLQVEINNLRDEQERIRSQTRLNLSSAEESKSRSKLNAISGEIAKKKGELFDADKKLTEERTRTQELNTAREQVEIEIRQFDKPAARNRADYHESPFGKFWEKQFNFLYPSGRR